MECGVGRVEDSREAQRQGSWRHLVRERTQAFTVRLHWSSPGVKYLGKNVPTERKWFGEAITVH